MLDVLLYTFFGVTGILLIYYFFVFSRFAFSKTLKSKNNALPPVSVIICAKNEAENLKKFLPNIINQEYPNFEIVLINDASYDESLDLMEAFQKKHSNIKIVNVENNEAFWGSKKYALTLGIKASSYDYLLFTDADCMPKSNQWIKEMASQFSNTKSFILGYGAYQKKKFSLLNALIRFETLQTAVQYFSYAKIGNPYMGVGRNLAYKKQDFFKINGFMNHMKIRSGDDDLFINEAATGKQTVIVDSEKSHTISTPSKSFKEWFQQKRRHISTANYYKTKDQFFLGLYYISQFMFWILASILLGLLFQWEIVLIVLSSKLLVQYLVFGFSAKKLKEQDLTFALPFLEIFLIIFQLVIFITNSVSKPNHWK
ncbi:glycosyltransferase [Pseudofulvibacter geojedonensis]|uniref:Glycosyltransferase n=1 Tax=Pseudofulvibacter geojedonensis TaxID=1123758 RepID=A0ABW3I589_9FLAO